MLCDMGILEIS